MDATAEQARALRQHRALLRVPAVAWLAIIAVLLATALLSLSDPSPDNPGAPDAVFIPLFLAMGASVATVGTLLAQRRSSNPIGWMLLAGAALMAVSFFGASYSQFSYGTGRNLIGAPLLAWFSIVAFVPGLVVTGLVILVFPSGRLSHRGLAILALVLVGLVLTTVPGAIRPGPLQDLFPIANPFGVDAALDILRGLEALGNALILLGFLSATVSLAARFHAAQGEERKQIEWFAYVAIVLAGALTAASLQIGPISDVAWTLAFVALTALPIAIAIAILKYRLYDIDTLVNRTLVYVPLVGILGGLYTAGVAFFQRMFLSMTGAQSDAAIVLTTLVVAGTFTPVRKNLESAVERRFRPAAQVTAGAGSFPMATTASRGAVDIEAILDDPRVSARMEEIARRVAAGNGSVDSRTPDGNDDR